MESGTECIALEPHECWDRIVSVSHGVVSLCIKGLPAIVPVTYRVVDDSIVVCVEGNQDCAPALHDAVVAFQADDLWSRDGLDRWCVHVVARATVPDAADERGTDTAARPFVAQLKPAIMRGYVLGRVPLAAAPPPPHDGPTIA